MSGSDLSKGEQLRGERKSEPLWGYLHKHREGKPIDAYANMSRNATFDYPSKLVIYRFSTTSVRSPVGHPLPLG